MQVQIIRHTLVRSHLLLEAGHFASLITSNLSTIGRRLIMCVMTLNFNYDEGVSRVWR